MGQLVTYIFIILTLAYVVGIRYFTVTVQDTINKIKLDDKREYTFARAWSVLLKRINILFIPSLILIYYGVFATYISTAGSPGSEFNMLNFFKIFTGKDGGKARNESIGAITTYIGALFMVCSLILLVVTNILIVAVKTVIYTNTAATTMLYITDLLKYILLLGIIGGIVIKTFGGGLASTINSIGSTKTQILVKYITALIFYIPCMLTNFVADVSNVKRNTPRHVLIVFIIQCILLFVTIIIPIIDGFLAKHLVNTILDGPIYLSNEYNYSDKTVDFVNIDRCTKKHVTDVLKCEVELMTSDEVTDKIQEENIDLYYPGKSSKEIEDALIDSPGETYKERPKFDYNYSYSFWFYINSAAENKNQSYSMINFAHNPHVKYNPSKNQIQIQYFGDSADGGAEVELSHIKLQKWNHLVLNYTSGRLDVFINGDIAVTKDSMPIKQVSAPIISGEYDGINGRIAAVVYYHKPLPKMMIDQIYNSGKNMSVPSGVGLISSLWMSSSGEGGGRLSSTTDVLSTGLAYITPVSDVLDDTYKYFEDLPHNLYIDAWALIDEYIFMFDRSIDLEEKK